MMNPLHIQPERTAFVAIDLQQGIVGMPGVPHSTSTVVRHAARLADALRRAGAFIVFVHVDFVDGKDALQPVAEKQLPAKPVDNWAELVPDLHVQPGDHLVVKRGFGAFFGTDLDLQLRRRGIDTILLCGISTHIGVDTTAREAYQLNYNQIFVTDAMTAPFKEAHEFPCEHVFPLMGRLHTTAEVLAALE
ncbi:MAG: isochorismatase family protein [Paenibacillus dendritiformis]|uniref:isochorismatase family protein n=1 Tax=Paenibacillus dendritiformis TaxID=130049 RepID=UPI001B30005C|nr:isochorismatase family protein [Paenibacillus dendritiformis]MDU5142230.1 isochorismatase family protein [Paenibacillus dendritiformis]